MIEGWDIIALTFSDWEAARSTPHHLMALLALCNRILWVNVPRSFLYGLKPHRFRHNDDWQGDPLREVLPNMHVYHPRHQFLPVGHLPYRVARQSLLANGRTLARKVQGVADSLGFRPGIVWSFSPLHGGAVPHLKRKLLVHDICDEWANYVPYQSGKRLVEWMDVELTRQADVTFVFSDHMRAQRERCAQSLQVVLPAGDVDFYHRATLPETTIPAELAHLPRPIIGAICVVDPARFDAPLLAHLAKAHPEWSIVVVGPVRAGVDLAATRAYSNIHILGDRPRGSLPAYLKAFDAAIVPYALNDATRGIYPMKLQEYLAAGKPVVSPALPACIDLSPLVRFAGSHEAFAQAVEAALESDTPDAARDRMLFAARNGWKQRLAIRCKTLAPLLPAI